MKNQSDMRSFGSVMSDHEYEEECKHRERRSKSFLIRTAFALVISICVGLFAFLSFFYPGYSEDRDPARMEEITEEKDFSQDGSKVSVSRLGIYGKYIDSSVSDKYNIPMGINVSHTVGNAVTAKIRSGDIITAINGTDVCSIDDISEFLDGINTNSIIMLDIFREGEHLSLGILAN